jgi:ADP-ribose pyrophosphatase YjhB (NUDIX family)
VKLTTARAYGIVTDNDQLLLVQSSNPRYQPPLWWLPGGGIDFGETPEEAVVREFDEETGLIVTAPTLLGVLSDVRVKPNGDHAHTIRLIYSVKAIGGELRHEVSGTTERAEWFTLEAVGGLNLSSYVREALALANLNVA